jgi:GABA(A) receptor-associated protein
MEFITQFQKESIETRLEKSNQIKLRYPFRIPVIIDRYQMITPRIHKHKYLIPKDMTIAHLLFTIRPQLKINESQSLFLFHQDTLIPTHTKLSELSTSDGFVYIIYSLENTFG